MLAVVAEDAAKLRDAIDTQADTMNRTIHGLEWSGAAFQAAGDRADREKTQQRAVATAYDDLSTALHGAENEAGWLIVEIKRTVHNLPADWSVADDFNITYHKDADKNAVDSTYATLTSLADQLGQAMDKWAPKIAEAVNAISATAPVSAEKCVANPADQFTAQQAQEDIKAVRNGTADASTLARLKSATDLDAEQKDALANGRNANLPQFEYLQGMSQAMNGMSAEPRSTDRVCGFVCAPAACRQPFPGVG
ncbi:TPR repeat region-containing protein [Nocardia nova]|nr:hypothetical protein [Nocardia nova]